MSGSSKVKNTTPKDEVAFYDAHPGLMGCPVQLPAPIKKVADELNGMPYSLSKAVSLFEKAAKKLKYPVVKIEVHVKGDNGYYVSNINWIGLKVQVTEELYPCHSWRIICYKTHEELEFTPEELKRMGKSKS
jgi:hypothetical protein